MNVDISARAQTLIEELVRQSVALAIEGAIDGSIIAARTRRDVAKQHLTEYIAHLEDCSAQSLTRQLNLAAAERIIIERAMQLTNRNHSRAAELLGIHVRTLRRRLNGGKR